MMMLLVRERFGAEPTPIRSSGMWARPWLIEKDGGLLAISLPSNQIRPEHGRRPVITSTNSLCPFPATPAMPRISPSCNARSTLRKAGRFLLFRAETSSRRKTSGPAVCSHLCRLKITSRPTISEARLSRVNPCKSIRSAVTRPRRKTVSLSATCFTSLSLWLMKAMDLPWAAIPFSVVISSSASWGARTAVGSSMMRIFAPR